jgi:lactoylglutathione lyase
MAPRIAHANLQVSDVQASLTFYRRLGLELVGCLRLNPVVLYYVAAPEDPNLTFELADNPGLESRSPGSGHIALAVGDLDALLGELAEGGIDPEKPPFHPAKGKDLRICFVQDPDGHRVELIEGEFPTPQDDVPAGTID